jgi:hypothetical protein
MNLEQKPSTHEQLHALMERQGLIWWSEDLGLHRNVQRFRGRLVSEAHRRLYHSTLGLRVKKKKKKSEDLERFQRHIKDQIKYVNFRP